MDKRTILIVGSMGLFGIFLFKGHEFLFMRVLCICIVLTALLLFAIFHGSEVGDSLKKFKRKFLGNESPNLKLRGGNKERAYIRVQNAIKNGKVFVSQEEDGIYIRFAGNENEGEAYSEHKVKVYTYEQ